jgi:hypothetical protein
VLANVRKNLKIWEFEKFENLKMGIDAGKKKGRTMHDTRRREEKRTHDAQYTTQGKQKTSDFRLRTFNILFWRKDTIL